MRWRVASSMPLSPSASMAHWRSTVRVGSISRRLRSSTMVRKISHTSCRATKWSRRSPSTCVTLTRPQLCSSFRLLLTFERATPSVSTICSAFSGALARNSSAWICATVRFTPQRVPISPQCRMYFCSVELKAMIFSYFCRYRNFRLNEKNVKPVARSGAVQGLIGCTCLPAIHIDALDQQPQAEGTLADQGRQQDEREQHGLQRREQHHAQAVDQVTGASHLHHHAHRFRQIAGTADQVADDQAFDTEEHQRQPEGIGMGDNGKI